MQRAVVAGSVYFGLVFALGVVLGTVRVVLLAPRVGEFAATVLELPVMLIASWFVCSWAIGRCKVPPERVSRWVMGVWAFALLVGAEILLGVVGFGRSPAGQMAAMLAPVGLLGLGAQVAFAAMPLLQMRARREG